MQERMFWPLTASFLVLVAVFFLAIDTSQNGDLSIWLRSQVGSTNVSDDSFPVMPTVALAAIQNSEEEVEKFEAESPTTSLVHFVGFSKTICQEPTQQSVQQAFHQPSKINRFSRSSPNPYAPLQSRRKFPSRTMHWRFWNKYRSAIPPAKSLR